MEFCENFRYDLKRGQEAEKWLGGLLEADTMEVKRDFIAHSTKRVFVEYECNGKPSGISTTEADMWAFVTDDCVLITNTDRLKELAKQGLEKFGPKRGGDNNKSLGALVELKQLAEFSLVTKIEEST
jgi:hypothetical protein|tara:strand:- start:754 stop:1134 length:381 start_codon:yes stop_codon:yes gene_type:complete